MDVALQVDQSVYENLKNQELSLKFVNEDEIQIIGNPKTQLFGKLLFFFLGSGIVAFSMILAQGTDTRSIIIMIVGLLIGFSLMVVPLYNFYSKKQFSVRISRVDRKVVVSGLRGQNEISFANLASLTIKSFKMDDYVNDETADSNSFGTKFFLNLSSGKEQTLFTFSSRDRKSLNNFSEAYGNFLANFMNIKLEKTGDK
ncbi:MAG: hypothetical protein ACNS60_17010 [Candidatus Cyclobacteriaceae bacterium M2_1C_046]